MESAVFLAFLGAISARQEVRYERCSWYRLMRSGQYEVLVQWVLREVEVSEAELSVEMLWCSRLTTSERCAAPHWASVSH
jgi:hypothetical protein